jgi:hypothetical protein
VLPLCNVYIKRLCSSIRGREIISSNLLVPFIQPDPADHSQFILSHDMHQSMITKTLLAGVIAATLSACVFGGAVPVQETGLSIRDSGDVAVFEEQKDLVKRVNAALVASALTALGAVTYAACQATAPIQPVVAASKLPPSQTRLSIKLLGFQHLFPN